MSSSAERPYARWPWAVVVFFVALAAAGATLVAANGESVAAQVPYMIAFLLFGIVGALVLSRDRRNVVGGLMLWASFFTALGFVAGELGTWLLTNGHRGLGAQIVTLLNSLGWLLGLLPVLFLLPLLFPDGHVPSRRWRPFLWLIIATLVYFGLAIILGSKTVSGSNEAIKIANPFYVSAFGDVLAVSDVVIGWAYFGIFAISVSSQFFRYRRAAGPERQQIRWAAFGFVVAFVGVFVSDLIHDPLLSAIPGGLGFLAFPVSIGIAVLRFHLYDLDVVVRKAVVYTLLAAFATVIYLGLVVGLGASLGRGSSFLTMLAAVIVAVTFQPVRRALNRFANRLVYGERATPYEVLSEFSGKVGGTYEDTDVVARMARVVGEGIGAERADVWLQVDHTLRDVAVWPADAHRLAPVSLPDGVVPPIADTDRVWPVEAGGELLGALAVRKPVTDPLSPSDEKLVGDLAQQAGLVLRNVKLSEELKVRLEELTTAQRRIVAAQDEGRRRLERNIHDGAQQRLVALAVKARLARTFAERDLGKTVEMLAQIETETQDALENLRDLARGIYPPLLTDKGLVSALEAQARKSPIPVAVQAEAGVGRYPQDAEAVAYFCALEALQNVAKYSEASRAEVHLVQDDGVLNFDVHDDGRGFDPEAAHSGSGLQGMADRLAAIGGRLEVTSAPGAGTTVSGWIPFGPLDVG